MERYKRITSEKKRLIRENRFVNKKINKFSRKRFQEEETSHKESIMVLADQITKYLEKHKGNPNSAVNDISMGLFLGFSEFYAHDGDPNSNGINMLQKVIDKVKTLSKNYDDLIPEPEDDFDLDAVADEVLSDEEDPNEDIVTDDDEEEGEEDDEENSDEDDIVDEEDEEEEKSEKKESYRYRMPPLHESYLKPKSVSSISLEDMNIQSFLENDSDVSEYQ